MGWISKERYYKFASRCNVKMLLLHIWVYGEDNEGKQGGWMILALAGALIDIPKMEVKKMLPPNVTIKPSKRLDQMVALTKEAPSFKLKPRFPKNEDSEKSSFMDGVETLIGNVEKDSINGKS